MFRLKAISILMLLVTVLFVVSCEDDDSGGSSRVYDFGDRAAVAVTSGFAGNIIKNEVAYYAGGAQYFEYLTFDSDTAGSYVLCKMNERGELKRVTSIDVQSDSGEELPYFTPTTFTYDLNTGELTAGSTKTFLFNTVTSGYFVANEELFPLSTLEKAEDSDDNNDGNEGDESNEGDEGSEASDEGVANNEGATNSGGTTLFCKWSTANKLNKFDIRENGLIKLQLGGTGISTTKQFYNDGGFIASQDPGAQDCSLLRLEKGGEKKLFYKAYHSTRALNIPDPPSNSTQTADRATGLDDNVIEFSSSDFIFWRAK